MIMMIFSVINLVLDNKEDLEIWEALDKWETSDKWEILEVNFPLFLIKEEVDIQKASLLQQ